MAAGNHPPPVINERQPANARPQLREPMPTQTAWLATFKQVFKNTNTRYAFLWLTGGILFSLFGKSVIRRREEDMMVSDIDNYLKNKKKTASE